MARSPQVFISYSHDSPEHSERVRVLAHRLREDGVDCTIDRYEKAPAEGWTLWMIKRLTEADFVLVACTPTYYWKILGKEPQGTGHGVIFEGALIRRALYDAGMQNEKFIPILFENLDPKQILDPLRDTTWYQVDTPEGYKSLLHRLTDQPEIVKPELGPLPVLPPKGSPVLTVESSEPVSEGSSLPGRARHWRWLWMLLGLCLLLTVIFTWAQISSNCLGRPDFLPSEREAREQYLEGLESLARFDAPLARRSFERVLEINDFPPARSALAEALVRLDLGGNARNEAQRAFAGRSRMPREEQLQVEARLRRIDDDWDSAVQAYHRLLGLYPRSCMRLEYGFGLVESLIGALKGGEALTELNKLHPIAKQDPRFYLWESWAAGSIGDYAAQRTAATKVIKAVEGKQGYQQLEAKALTLRGDAEEQTNDLDAAISDLDKAQRYYTQAFNRRGTTQVLDTLAQAQLDKGQLKNAEQTRRRAMAIYQELKDPKGLGFQHLRLAQVLSEQGKLAEARSLAELAIQELGAIEDSLGQAQALGDLGQFLQRQGKLPEAIKSCRQAIKLARDIGNREEEARQLDNLAEVQLRGMELRRAEETLVQLQQMAKEMNNPQAMVLALKSLGEVAIAQGNLEQAEKRFEEALDRGRKLKDEETVADSQFGLAMVLLEKGHPEDAADQLKEAWSFFEGKRMRDREAEAEALRARTLLAQDRPTEAKSVVESARRLADSMEFPELHIEISLTEARVHERLGERDTAIRILQEVLARAQQVGFASGALEARLILGEIEALKGNRSRLQEVEKEARIHGFLLIADKARRLLDGRNTAPV